MNISKWNKMSQLEMALKAKALTFFAKLFYGTKKKLKCKFERFPNSGLLFKIHADNP